MKTLLLAVVLCQLYTSLAQTPPVPVLPETFVATGEVEVHQADFTGFGEFEIARNEVAQMGLEKENYNGVGRDEISEALYHYDMNVTYYLRGDKMHAHCLQEDRNFNGMPKYWQWLQYANYEGKEQVREIDYDLWAVNIGGVRFEFGKPVTNSSIVYTYRRKSAELSVYYSIMKFDAVAPSADDFQVPQECKDFKKKN